MQYNDWLPYILGTLILILGSAPILFLPETLEEAKANKARYRREANSDATKSSSSSSSNEPIEPAGKRPVLQEVIHQAREFKDSTQFIWRDYSVWVVILCLLVSVISRQSSGVLLQYASKKFNWSIARVCSCHIYLALRFANLSTDQPVNFTTWRTQSHQLPRHHASIVLCRCQVSQPARQTSRSPSEPGERTDLNHWLPCHGTCTCSNLANLRIGDSLPGFCVPHHCAQSGDQFSASRSRRHSLLGYCDLPVPRDPSRRSIICLPLPDWLTPRRCLAGTSLLASQSALCDSYGRHMVHSSPSSRARRKRRSRAIIIRIAHRSAPKYEAPETWNLSVFHFVLPPIRAGGSVL